MKGKYQTAGLKIKSKSQIAKKKCETKMVEIKWHNIILINASS